MAEQGESLAESGAGGETPPMMSRGRDLKRNFGWALAGNMIYQASQWLNLVLLAKLTAVEEVGSFALAMAIATPVSSSLGLNLALVQVTDSREQFEFGHFLALRVLTTAAALLVSCTIAAVVSDGPRTGLLIGAVAFGQAVIMIRDVFLSFSQKRERMDVIAVSKTILGVASLLVFSCIAYATRDVLVSVAGMQLAKLLVFIFWDLRQARNIVPQLGAHRASYFRPIWAWRPLRELFLLALPLGLAQTLLQLTENAPRYLITSIHGDAELGYFAALMSMAIAGMQVLQAAAAPALPRLGRYYAAGDVTAFRRLLIQLVLFGIFLGFGGILVAWLWGKSLLSIVFRPEYADYDGVFVAMMVFSLVAYVVVFLRQGAVAMRLLRIQLLAEFASLVVVLTTGVLLIPSWALLGAVVALTAGQLTVGMFVLGSVARHLVLPLRGRSSERG